MADGSKIKAWLRSWFGRQSPDAIAPQAVALHRLLFLLLPALEARGFLFSPDRYIRLQRLLQTLPTGQPPSKWRHALCAVLASDVDQQRAFNLLFDQCLSAIDREDKPSLGPGSDIQAIDPKSELSPSKRPSDAPRRQTTTPRQPETRPGSRPLVVDLDECIEPPFSWNIVPEKADMPVEGGPGFGRTLIQLRRREIADQLLPDLPASIRATIDEGGVPTFRYRNPTRPTEYLLLVERFALDDHRAALFDHFYHTLRQSEVIIDRFYYQGDLRLCRNERFPSGLNLQQLRYRYPDARLVVVGTGYRLISARTGEPSDWLRPLYSWRRRVLLTPVSRFQWGQRERVLQSLFSLLPASLQSLHYLSDAPDEALHGDYETLPEYVRRIAETEPLALEEPFLRALRKHFDPGLLGWIAACAVYPALHFELTLRLGNLLSESLGYNLLQATNLLALARIPWFTEGRMPPEARTQLLEWFEHRYPEQHRLVLDYLHTLMENNPPPENSMAWAEHRINLALLELARNPEPDAETLAQLRAVVKRLDRPQKRGDFVLPRHWKALLDRIGFEPEAPPPTEPPPGPETEGPLRAGMIFAEKFRLDVLIGKGGSGQVWQATLIESDKEEIIAEEPEREDALESLQDGELVAIKIFIGGERYYDYCIQEFKQTNSFEHPHIVHLFECGLWNGYPWQSMPIYRPLTQAGQWEEKELWLLLHDIASALAYLHSQKPPVKHNDIKPAQFLQNEDGAYLLTDFGISGELLKETSGAFSPTIDLRFSPLEWVTNRVSASASDVYALAASLFYLATGKPPFDSSIQPGEHWDEAIKKRLKATELNPPALHTRYSNELNQLLMQCLRYEPASRPGAKEVWEIAAGWLRERGFLPVHFDLPDMVIVKGGVFQMGCTGEQKGDCQESEKPAHEVRVQDFSIGRTAVTVEQYMAFVEDTKSHFPEWMEEGSPYNIKTGKEDHYKKLGDALQAPDHPIVGISWNNAVAYCQWLSQKTGKTYRLPTEAEWEYAARGGKASKGFKYAGSDELDEVAWYTSNSGGRTHPVGKKNPNELGLYDMSGNVWEWCEDDWHANYKDAPVDGRAWVDSPKGSSRVVRGGSWFSGAGLCRVALRIAWLPTYRYSYVGFRLVLQL